MSVARLKPRCEVKALQKKLVNDKEPKFVASVKLSAMVAHPLVTTSTSVKWLVASDKTVQIVAGAPNARVGLKTIAALPGAMMPKGNLIFPGELRGERVFGTCKLS